METNKIYHIDCLEGLKQLPDSCIDLIMTDPPYILKCTRAGGHSQIAKNIQPVNDLLEKNNLTSGMNPLIRLSGGKRIHRRSSTTNIYLIKNTVYISARAATVSQFYMKMQKRCIINQPMSEIKKIILTLR